MTTRSTSAPQGRSRSGQNAPAVQRIRAAIQASEERTRKRHGWLAYQDAIGFVLQVGAVASMVACAWAYIDGSLPAWLTVLLVALLASITHEMEHDLIHHLYFKGRPAVQNFLLLIGWLARPSTINPWKRRNLHFHHHKRSGSASDLEERGITNGERWGLRRLLMLLDGRLALVLRPITLRQMLSAYVKEVDKPKSKAEWLKGMRREAGSYWPLGTLFWTAWHAWLAWHGANAVAGWLGHTIDWPAAVAPAMEVLDIVAVCLLIPNIIRSFCLHFISSSVHYYGDIDSNNIVQQTMVLNHPLFWPFQLFCFNFGATHAVHHFVVGQPFYLRQMIAREAHAVMQAEGVRFNDLDAFRRNNRWHDDSGRDVDAPDGLSKAA